MPYCEHPDENTSNSRPECATSLDTESIARPCHRAPNTPAIHSSPARASVGRTQTARSQRDFLKLGRRISACVCDGRAWAISVSCACASSCAAFWSHYPRMNLASGQGRILFRPLEVNLRPSEPPRCGRRVRCEAGFRSSATPPGHAPQRSRAPVCERPRNIPIQRLITCRRGRKPNRGRRLTPRSMRSSRICWFAGSIIKPRRR